MRVAINGLGRIGRCLVRGIFESEEYKDIELVAVNGPALIETHIHLLKYDSIHGRFSKKVEANKDSNFTNLTIKKLKLFRERKREDLWKDLGVDIVLESNRYFYQ